MIMLILILSIISISIAILLLRKSQRVMRKGKRSIAVIIDNRLEPDSDGDIYYPIIQFTTGNNVTVTKEMDWGSNRPRRVGKKLSIAYNPEKPDDLLTNPTLNFRILPIILFALAATGIIVIALGVV